MSIERMAPIGVDTWDAGVAQAWQSEPGRV